MVVCEHIQAQVSEIDGLEILSVIGLGGPPRGGGGGSLKAQAMKRNSSMQGKCHWQYNIPGAGNS